MLATIFECCLFLVGCVPIDAPKAESPPSAVVEGSVEVVGALPQPRMLTLRGDVAKAVGRNEIPDQTWLVGKDRGLANCVVTLVARDPQRRVKPPPMKNVVLEKDGAFLTPRVLVVPVASELIYRNKNSPCQELSLRGTTFDWSASVPAGREKTIKLDNAKQILKGSCGIHHTYQTCVYVTDTPYYTLTDKDGRFSLVGVPPGDYLVTVWHEGLGKATQAEGPGEVKAEARKSSNLRYQVTQRVNGK